MENPHVEPIIPVLTSPPDIEPVILPTVLTEAPKKNLEKVHFHAKQRNQRKYITTIEGLLPHLEEHKVDIKDFMKTMKKKLSCNGNVSKNDSGVSIIQFQGDHRKSLADYLIKQKILEDQYIAMHGITA